MKVISATYRIQIVGSKIEQRILKNGQVPIYASWHQRFFAGLTFFSKRRPISIIISRSKDGDLVAKVAGLLGWHPVRGSSSRGGKKAMYDITKLAHKGYKIGHIVDGPRGPHGVVKPGLINIARLSGMPIVPTITSAEKKWVFNSWDRFIVPKPFSRVIIRFGDEIHIPSNLGKVDFEKKRSAVEIALKQFVEETDRMWKEPETIQYLFGN